jgi:UDP-perosamine 4-acetyltransferase
MSTEPRPAIILGGGGHARVLADCLQLAGRTVLGFTAPERLPPLAPGIEWLGDDTALAGHDPAAVALVNGLGSVGRTAARQQLFEELTAKGYDFAAVRHPTATLSGLDVAIGAGCQLLAGSLVGPGARLGDNVLLNSRAVVEHDCEVGDHCHVATGAILCGGCQVGSGVHVGAGATVIQGITIGNGAIIAAGAVVTKNVEPLTLVAGVPGRPREP